MDQLNDIHLRRESSGGLPWYRQSAARDYRRAFEQAGLVGVNEPLQAAVPRIKASPVRPALVAALDDWTLSVIVDRPLEHELFPILSQVDPQSERDDIPRQLAAEPDSNDLFDRINRLNIDGCSISSLLVLGERLMLIGRNPRDFLQRVQLQYPADFWTNLALGDVYMPRDPASASIYYRAALASRPRAAVGYLNLGNALAKLGNFPEAIDFYHRGLALNPNLARAECDLGNVLRKMGREDEAMACDERALKIDPNYAWTHDDLGWVYLNRNQLEDALREFHYVVLASPYSPDVQSIYRSTAIRLGRAPQVWAEWKRNLDDGALWGFDAWNGYAELCLYLHHDDDYRRARTALLRLFSDRNNPRVMEPIARAALLQPGSAAELQQATDLARRAEVADRGSDVHPYSAFVVGLAEYRAGHDELAFRWMTEAIAAHHLGPCPCLVQAMALNRMAKVAEARQALWNAVINEDWEPTRATAHDSFLYFILRREAELAIWPDLPQVLAGQATPGSNEERLALLGICQETGRHAQYAQLYADAVSADPEFPEHSPWAIRRIAAGAAVLAGCGEPGGNATLCPAQQTQWREQGLQWLKDQLALQMSVVDYKNKPGCAMFRSFLAPWQHDTDLARVREPAALAHLPAEEQEHWQDFWESLQTAMDQLAGTRTTG